MPEDSKSPRSGEDTAGGVPMLDSVARRIEQLSLAVAEQTERLLEQQTNRASDADLAAILEAARRSSELARELVTLARRERDAAAAVLLSVTANKAAPSERPRESVPAVSHRRVRGGVERVALLVEDEPLLLKTMCRMLEQYVPRIVAASNPVEALALAAGERHIELLVTDLVLPGMSGGELVKRLRSSRPDLRVLYTSGWDPSSSGVKLRTDGSEAFLSKPFTAAELDVCLSELLGVSPLRFVERG